MSWRDRAEEAMDGSEALFMDGLDGAIIGTTHDIKLGPRVVYDEKKIIEILAAGEMDDTDAWEYYSFNIAGAYVGEGTPVIVHLFADEELEDVDAR